MEHPTGAESARESPLYQAELINTLVNACAQQNLIMGDSDSEQKFLSSTKNIVNWSIGGVCGCLTTYGMLDRFWIRFKFGRPVRAALVVGATVFSVRTGYFIGSMYHDRKSALETAFLHEN